MANKKNNKRKIVAVALGIVGIAGLSMASAAQLNIDTGNEVALGTDEFTACAETALVEYTYAPDSAVASGFAVDEVTVTLTEGNCTNANVEVSFDDHNASAKGALTGATFTSALTGAPIDIEDDLGAVTVIIG